MSRCFPYPPPCFLRNGAHGEAAVMPLSESIKRDLGKAITEHDKKERKEKKESKKGRKGNKKALYIEGTCNQLEKRLPSKGKEEEAERSGLTEEHDQPVCSESRSCSSDGTRSSNKRKGDDSEYKGTKSQQTGNLILRIQLPLKRLRETDASVNGEQLCSTSGRSDSNLQQKKIIQMPVKGQCSAGNSNNCRRDLKRHENSAVHFVKTASGMLSHRKEVQTAEALYKSLIEDWAPPALELEQTNFDDEEWLFQTKKQETRTSKRFKSHPDEPRLESSTLWPSACYLHQADVYALPYTIPF
ncbi:uncharacterized protein LOC110655906 isoform X2 [Hevea brasiliensis]|uniref:uncharacterized protein LOC110655906 isoform X2 n=1 Tax=Hevea brasiliensis TaxID=3981 RepID=UPI0025CC3C72|nr:uncharacterized protein LOC110655906 isoform X2 [Hevea brasiliensis]